jgi:hypothetical protein
MLAIENSSAVKEAPEKSLEYLRDYVRQSGAKSYDSLALSLYRPNKGG